MIFFRTTRKLRIALIRFIILSSLIFATNAISTPSNLPPQSLNYSVKIIDPEKLLTPSEHSLLLANLDAAIKDWERYIYGKAPLRIELRIASKTTGGRFDAASRTYVFLRKENELNVYEELAAYKLRTGLDPDPKLCDLYININLPFMRQHYWLDPKPNERTIPVPKDKTDVVTALAHELGHTFGINGILNRNTGKIESHKNVSNFDLLIAHADSGFPAFNGMMTKKQYGESLPLTFFIKDSFGHKFNIAGIDYYTSFTRSQNLYHIGRYASEKESLKTLQSLMSGAWLYHNKEGLRIRVSEVDAAILGDLGIPLKK